MSSLNRFGDPRSALRPLAATLLLALAAPVGAETESITGPIGSDTAHTFAHAAVPGAVAMSFHFAGGFAPMYPDTETHTVVVVFEWGPTPAGPWTASPDHVKSVPGGTTAFFDTGVFSTPGEAPFVQLHFYAGGLMFVSGAFDHVSVVPEPATAALWLAGLAGLAGALRRRAARAD
ncbi:MAG: PEP-CTERM sorting domain-containing protein [Rubrivivax sp.]|nr:PEP-CTERM sorting domain-containing protein [Rubrivivax sp.]